MNWNSQALAAMRELTTNCSDFIYGASEFVATQRQHDVVQIEDVNCVLEFIAKNTQETGKPELK